MSYEGVVEVHFDNLLVGQESGSFLEERHLPNWKDWGKRMHNRFGRSLGFDFEEYGTVQQSSGGYNDEKWLATDIAGAFSNGTMVIDGAFKFVEHSKTGRFLANGYQHISKAEMAKSLKLAKPLTRGVAGVNLISQTISVADDFSHGRWKSGTTRGVVNGIILGVTAVNPLLGFGLGVAEALWGEHLYEYVEKNW
ncbi:MAG TPA: hypothetical protein VLZ83_12470 [Edaphocola sp.]|nr:hypothetical protein [Edaphocola sp.]